MRRLIVEVEDITAKPSSFRFEIQPSTGVGRRAKTPSQLTFIGRSRNCFGIRHGTVDAGDIGGNDQYAPSPEIIDQRTLALPLMCPFPPFMLERSRIRCACGFVRTRRKLGPQAAAR